MIDFKSQYKGEMNKIAPDDNLLKQLRSASQKPPAVTGHIGFFAMRRHTFLSAAACLALVIVVAAGAAVILNSRSDLSSGSVNDGANIEIIPENATQGYEAEIADGAERQDLEEDTEVNGGGLSGEPSYSFFNSLSESDKEIAGDNETISTSTSTSVALALSVSENETGISLHDVEITYNELQDIATSIEEGDVKLPPELYFYYDDTIGYFVELASIYTNDTVLRFIALSHEETTDFAYLLLFDGERVLDLLNEPQFLNEFTRGEYEGTIDLTDLEEIIGSRGIDGYLIQTE